MSELRSDLKLNIQELLDREDLPNETTWGAEWSKAVRQQAIAQASSSVKSASTTKNWVSSAWFSP